MLSLIYDHGRHCMPYIAKYSVKLQTENFSIETSDFLRQIIFLKLFEDCLPCLLHGFRNKYFNRISLDNMLYFQNKIRLDID